MSVYVIAEAGVNHNGDVGLAVGLADAARRAGADCVKFQTFRADRLVARSAPKADYQRRTTSDASQLDMLRRLELSDGDFVRLREHCRDVGIDFVSTPFDLDSIAFLDGLSMPFWKIPSGEVTDLPYLLAMARTGKPVVMSTGMCTMEEIAAAMDVLRSNGTPGIALLHCNTEYPTPFGDVNLLAMRTMRERFGVEVGYSDHTPGIEVAIAAAAMGATIVEKHLTLDRGMEGPDHRASLEPDELARMVEAIRHVEQAMGTGAKEPSPSERRNMAAARRSIVARTAIRRGELLTEANLTTKRPGTGVSPMRWHDLLGTRAVRDFAEDEPVEP